MVETFLFFACDIIAYPAWRLDYIATPGTSLTDVLGHSRNGVQHHINTCFYLLFGFKIPLAASAYEVTTFSFSPSKVFFEEHGLHSAGALNFPGARSQGGIQF